MKLRIIYEVPVVPREPGSRELDPWPVNFEGSEDATRIDVVPLEDAEILRVKANAWDYAVRRGFLGSSKVTAAQDFARLGDADVVAELGPEDVIVYRTPDLPPEQVADLAEGLSELFPENRVVIYPVGTGGMEIMDEDDARALPGIDGALDELSERRKTPARKPRES